METDDEQSQTPGNSRKFRPRLPCRPYIEDKQRLELRLKDFQYRPPDGCRRVPWVETLSLTSVLPIIGGPEESDGTPPPSGAEESSRTLQQLQKVRNRLYTNVPPKTQPTRIYSDIARETAFKESMERAVEEGLRRLQSLSIRFTRPPDFLAEMLKTDEQMRRVKQHTAAQLHRISVVEARKNKLVQRKFHRLSGHVLLKNQNRAHRANAQVAEIARQRIKTPKKNKSIRRSTDVHRPTKAKKKT